MGRSCRLCILSSWGRTQTNSRRHNSGPEFIRSDAGILFAGLAEGNLSIYREMAWVFAAYQNGEMSKLDEFKKNVPAPMYRSFALLDQGKTLQAKGKTHEAQRAFDRATESFAYYEQHRIIQPIIDKNHKAFRSSRTLWNRRSLRELALLLTNILSQAKPSRAYGTFRPSRTGGVGFQKLSLSNGRCTKRIRRRMSRNSWKGSETERQMVLN